MRKFYYILSAALSVAICISCGKPDQNENNNSSTSETAAPDAPAGLILHSSTENSLTFQWNSMSGATSYSYTLAKDAATVSEGSVKVRNVKIYNLSKGTEYVFTVCRVAGDYKSKGSSLSAKTAGEAGDNNGNDDPSGVKVSYADFEIPAVEEDGKARAFPGAEGGGMYTSGGRGGAVYHVTSLADDGSEGTLRYAINQKGPRTVVFDVAGTIALQSVLKIQNGDITIAGQTAPGDGICLKNYTFRIHASNVIVRFIRCRMGDETKTEDDAIQVMDKYGDSFENIIIDHCSVSWSTDECTSFYGMKDFTFQWNIVSESLRNSVHDKGAHGYGGIWGGTNATYHHNLLAHHDSRNPRIDHDYVSHQKGPVSIFNNVVYNWSGNTCYGGESSANNGSDHRKYNFFNNYYKPGPATPSNHIWFLQPTTSCSNCGGTIIPGHFFMEGNYMYGKSDLTADNWKAGTKSPVSVYFSESAVSGIKNATAYTTGHRQSIHTAENCLEPVLDYAGASYARDNIDARIARETREGTSTYKGSKLKDKDGNTIKSPSVGGLIDTQTDVQDATWKNGWPVYTATQAQLEAARDSDKDGIPDAIEDAWGLNKKDASDGNAFTIDTHMRYTNLEMYLHYLVKEVVSQGNKGSDYKDL